MLKFFVEINPLKWESRSRARYIATAPWTSGGYTRRTWRRILSKRLGSGSVSRGISDRTFMNLRPSKTFSAELTQYQLQYWKGNNEPDSLSGPVAAILEWQNLVGRGFTSRSITNAKDRLPAISRSRSNSTRSYQASILPGFGSYPATTAASWTIFAIRWRTRSESPLSFMVVDVNEHIDQQLNFSAQPNCVSNLHPIPPSSRQDFLDQWAENRTPVPLSTLPRFLLSLPRTTVPLWYSN